MMLRLYLIALPIFFGLDLLWLGVVAKRFYQSQLAHLMRDNVNWWAAMFFYLLFIGGMVLFVIAPAMEKKSGSYALIYGALFGLITYATYDLTNLATLKNWPLVVVFVDIAWGIVLSMSVCFLSYLLANKLGL